MDSGEFGDNYVVNCEQVFGINFTPAAAAEGMSSVVEEMSRITPETITPEQRELLIRLK